MTEQTTQYHPYHGTRIVTRDGYTKRHPGSTCQTCGGKVTDDNAEKVCYPQTERRGFNKGRTTHIITGNYGRCRSCAAAAR